MSKEIFYLGFPGVQMGTHREPIRFEVVEEYDRAVRIRLLDDEPPMHLFEDLEYRKAGDGVVIASTYTLGVERNLLEILRDRSVTGFYRCKADDTHEPPIEDFAAVFFGFRPGEGLG